MSLFDAAERFASIDRSQVVLDPKRCLHAQDQHSDCAACFEVCPVNAIVPGKPPSLAAESCQSCLACLPVCPVGAYAADDDVSALLSCSARVEDTTIEIICGLHPAPETSENSDSIGIRIHGCLAGLGSGAYLTLFALGQEHLFLRMDACSDCKWGRLAAEIVSQAERANRFLSVWNKAESVVCVSPVDAQFERPVWDVKNPPLSRRDLFRMLGRQGQVALARAMENGIKTSKRQPGRDRLRLLAAVSHLPEYSSGTLVGLGGFGFAALTISSDCTACGVCAKACPTEALQFEKDQAETAFKLTFLPQNCIGCDLCLHVCAPAVITLENDPAFENVFGIKEPAVVNAGELIRCDRCKAVMAAKSGLHLCPLCEYRRSHPFGSIMPAELKAQIEKTAKERHS